MSELPAEQEVLQNQVTASHEITKTITTKMGDGYRRLSMAANLPAPGSPTIQDTIEHLREPGWQHVKEVLIAPDTKDFYDEPSGLQVDPIFVGGTTSLDPETFDPQFTVPAREDETTVQSTATWLANHFGEKAAVEFIAERTKDDGSISKAPVVLRILTPSSTYGPYGQSYYLHSPTLAVGSIHKAHHRGTGPPVEMYMSGIKIPLSFHQLNIFASCLDRAASKLVPLDWIDTATLTEGNAQTYTYLGSLERSRQEELESLITGMVQVEPASTQYNDARETAFTYADVTEGMQARALATQQFIAKRALADAQYRPETYGPEAKRGYMASVNYGHEPIRDYGDDPEKAAAGMAQHDAEIVSREAPNAIISITALDRVNKMWDDALAENQVRSSSGRN